MDADSASKLSENIRIGMTVKIQRKRTDKILEGIVTSILDDEVFNENGIEVEIDDCYQGNIKNIINDNDNRISPHEILKKIAKHESKYFEMKSSFKYDLNLSQRFGKPIGNEVLKRKIIEEAASFMNTEGGIICIGVDNEKNIIGLEHEYELQSDYDPNRDPTLMQDKLRLEIKQVLVNYLDDETVWGLFDIEIIPINGKHVCCIILKKSPEPIFVKLKNIPCRIDNKDTKVTIWKCWIRADNGIQSIEFDSFLKLWINRN